MLLVVCLISLAVPLLTLSAGHDSQRMAADRLSDAAVFAALAEPALRTGQTAALKESLSRYHQVYGVHGAVVDADSRTVVTSDASGAVFGAPRGDLSTHTGVADHLRRALAGEVTGFEAQVLPWGPELLVVALPVNTDGEVVGAVVSVSPTDRVRATTTARWLGLAGAGAAALALCIVGADRLSRWALRPISRLESAVSDIAAGRYAVRVDDGAGPPELGRLVLLFNQMADTVNETVNRQQSFISHASHQLRNPLTSLLLRIEAIGQEPLSADGRTDHRLAIDEAQRLSTLLDDLLRLARGGQQSSPAVTVDAVDGAASRIEAWRPLADVRGCTLALETDASNAPVRSVPSGLDQTLDALLDNALKFGAQRVTVRVTGGGRPGVEVIDDGPGLTAAEMARATETFWQANSAHASIGFGIGLSIASTLTEMAGGALELCPAVGGGLLVRLHLLPPVENSEASGSASHGDGAAAS